MPGVLATGELGTGSRACQGAPEAEQSLAATSQLGSALSGGVGFRHRLSYSLQLQGKGWSQQPMKDRGVPLTETALEAISRAQGWH